MTVARLMAAADLQRKPEHEREEGNGMPPPSPSSAPRPPAPIPAATIVSAKGAVMTGM